MEQDNWQYDVLAEIGQGTRWVSIRSGHGVGKTALLSWLILWFASTRFPFKIPCTANTESQLQDVLWSEVAKWQRKMPHWLADRLEISTGYLRLKGHEKNCFATARTAKKDRPEALQGFHDENLMFIVDEASGVDNIIFEVAHGSLSTEGCLFILTGNPTRADGYFKESFGKNRRDFKTYAINSELVSRCSRDLIERVSSQYGVDSDVYRVRVQGEFPLGNNDAYIPLWLLEEAIGREVEPIDVMPNWGVDVARYGNCASALSKRGGNVQRECVKLLYKRSIPEVAGWVIHEYRHTPEKDKPGYIIVDAIGLGAGVADLLEQEIGTECEILMLNVGETSYTPDCIKLRDYLYQQTLEWFSSKAVRIEDDAALVSDLSVVRGAYDSRGKLKIELKDGMIKRLGRSPDAGDSFILTFAAPPKRRERKSLKDRNKEMPSFWVA